MKRFLILVLAFGMFAGPMAWAETESPMALQQSKRQVSGTVTDAAGSPIVGATVMIPGSTTGVTTDANGHYAITVPDGTASLVVSCLGYKSETISAKGDVANVTLAEDYEMLEELVYVGYGTMKKANITGAISAVSSETIKDLPATTITEALQGKVAGVYVSKNSGVGASSSIYIRGAGSVNGMSPLYIIDGIPGGSNVGLNMEDIESLQIIKDASAAAIYGSNAAGGVILITTKSGKSEKPVVKFNANVGISKAGKSYDLLQTGDYLKMRSETVGSMIDLYNQYLSNPSSFPNTDWAKELNLTGAGIDQDYNFSVSGKSSKLNYYLSAQYQKEDGLQYDWWRYISVLSKVEYQVAKNLKIGTRINVGKTNNNDDTVGWRTMLRSVPFMTVREADGSFTPVPETAQSQAVDNYVAELDRNKDQKKGSTSTDARLYLDWDILPCLRFNVTGSATFGSGYAQTYTKENLTRVTYASDNYNISSSHSENYRYFATLTFDKDFGKHNLNVMAGYEAGWWMSQSMAISGKNSTVPEPMSTAMVTVSSSSGTLNLNGRALAQFARLNYSYDDRYFLTANVRRDGSTKFGTNYRFGVFPSVSAGWKITSEPWFKNLGLSNVNLIKPRVSYGLLGNTDALSEYMYQKAYSALLINAAINWWDRPNYVPVSYSFDGTEGGALPAYSMAKVTNNDLRWESVNTFDIGADLSFFQNRLEATFDWYNRHTVDMLYNISLPSTSGVSGSMPINIGSISNKGIEFALTWKDKIGDLHYSVSGNISRNKNLVENIGAEEAAISAGTLNITNGNSALTTGHGTHYTVNGQPLGMIWGFKTDGIISSQAELDALNAKAKDNGFDYYQTKLTGVGDLKYVDLNGDGHITADDADFIGNPWPKLQYGGNITLEWKGIDFSADFVGIAGRDVVNCMKPFEYVFQTDYQSTTKMLLTSFTNGNGLTEYPRIYNKDENGAITRDPNGNYQVMSDFLVENGSFMKIKNITVGYTFPKKLSEKVNISNLRVFFTGNNLITFTKFSGLDPEFSGSTTAFGNYAEGTPMTQLYTFGINLTFGDGKRAR